MRRALIIGSLLLCACGASGPTDFGSDAGEDSGRADSGVRLDSGVSDGGTDGGAADAGAGLDAGPGFDAGRDAGSGTDAGSDAGAANDAGPIDSGAQDAGGPLDGGAIHFGELVGGAGAWPGFISGVHYRSGSQAGFTDDAGTFGWQDGAPLTFSIGDVDFRPTVGKSQVSAWQLANPTPCVQSVELERALVMLASLDVDGDPSTGTTLTAEPMGGSQRAFSGLSNADVASFISARFAGRAPVAISGAVDSFIHQVDSEVWVEKSLDTFTGAAGGVRSQGVTTDGTSWFFSWRLGLERTDLSFNTTKSNSLAIPPLLALGGSNHIGDIDLDGTTLWAPIEDGTSYQKPYLVEFDSTTLAAGATHLLSNTLLTAGVPWVAVDKPRTSLYVAQWDPTPGIYVYSLSGVVYQRTISIRPTLGRIQGAKVFEGNLYASLDDALKSVFKINLETGTAQRLFSVGGGEMEGLAFLARPDGTLLHTQNANPGATEISFRHHQRTREPLRKALCP